MPEEPVVVLVLVGTELLPAVKVKLAQARRVPSLEWMVMERFPKKALAPAAVEAYRSRNLNEDRCLVLDVNG